MTTNNQFYWINNLILSDDWALQHRLYTLWKFVAEIPHLENHNDENNIKEGFTENYTETVPLLFRNEKTS